MIDAPDRKTPRFPSALELAVRSAIDQELERHGATENDIGIGSLACGSDILFAESLLKRGVRLSLYLPFPESEFLLQSVAFAGADWTQRYHAVTARATVQVVPEDSLQSGAPHDSYERTNLWMLGEARRLGGRDIVFLCVWNGEGGDGPGGTQHMVDAVHAVGGNVSWINPRNL